MALEYIALGTGAAAALAYTAYCHHDFYKKLKKTLIKKQEENKNRYKTLNDVFKDSGVYLYNSIQPRSGLPPDGDIGTIFLKPTIHLAKVLLKRGAYDNQNA